MAKGRNLVLALNALSVMTGAAMPAMAQSIGDKRVDKVYTDGGDSSSGRSSTKTFVLKHLTFQQTGSHKETRHGVQQVWVDDPPPPPPPGNPRAGQSGVDTNSFPMPNTDLANQVLDRAQMIANSWGTSVNTVLSVMQQEQGGSNPFQSPGALEDPLVLDLNGNGSIDVTGKSSAELRRPDNLGFVKQGSVMFDIEGDGQDRRIEWVRPSEGILVDNRKGAALKAVKAGKKLTIDNLLGDSEGFVGGFAKLNKYFNPKPLANDPKILAVTGKNLDNLMVWIDSNGDGKATLPELQTLKSLGITEIRLPAFYEKKDGEAFHKAAFVRDGKVCLVQEVWFARENLAAAPNLEVKP